MKDLRVATVGAVCAILTTVVFVIGIAFMATSGVQVLIPDAGKVDEWIGDVDDAGGLFFVGAWLVILGGLFGLVALVGFYDALRNASPALIIAPVAGVSGLVLVTISHLIPIAMAYEVVPSYVDATGATKESVLATGDAFGILALLTNYVGDALGWVVAVPLYGWAVLRTGLLPKWIGWLGVVVGAFALIGLLGPASSVAEGLTFPGFVGFFVWMAAMGITLLRRRNRLETAPL